MTTTELAGGVFGLGLLLATVTLAAAEDMTGMDGLPEYQPGQPWHEEVLQLPPYPAEEVLIRLDTSYPGYRYFIDPASVSVGEQDQVARYTVVVETNDGARNVFYEGIRCDTRQYKTYAYGYGDGPFHAMPTADWKEIRNQDALRYRADLADFYVCDGPAVRFDAKQIVKRIQYPPSVHDSTYVP